VEAELAGGGFRLPLEYFRVRKPVWLLVFDGSLKGVGLEMSRMTDRGFETVWVSSVKLPFDLIEGDSSFQNTVEFIAVITAYAIMAKRGHKDLAIHLKGDSTTALSWAKDQRFRIGRSRNSAVVYTVMHMETGFRSEETEFFDSESNFFCDDMSRLVDPAGQPYNYPENMIERIDCSNPNDLVGMLIRLCDPLLEITGEEGIIKHWGVAKGLAKRLEGGF
jgi:hypothetical protein